MACAFVAILLSFMQLVEEYLVSLKGCLAAVERLPALHYSVDFIFLSFGIMSFIVELWGCWRVTDDA